jgi:hypothetical protein
MYDELNETLLCVGCNQIFTYTTYLTHLESNICTNETVDNQINTTRNTHVFTYDYNSSETDEIEIENQNESHTETQYINNDLYNPFINRSFYENSNNDQQNQQNNQINQLIEHMNHTGFGLVYIECYSTKYNLVSETQCPICIDIFSENTEFYKMICEHVFCINCAEKWFKLSTKCPLCNQNLENL